MVRTAPIPRATVLLVVMVAAPSLAGCMGDDAPAKDLESPFERLRRTGESLGLEDYRDLVETPAPASCSGCLDLDTPDVGTRVVPPPTILPDPDVVVPFPAIGDRVRVTGVLGAGITAGIGTAPLPAGSDGFYDLELVVSGHGGKTPDLYEGPESTVVFEVGGLGTDDAQGTGTEFVVQAQELRVSLRTRMVVEAYSEGYAIVQPESVVGAGLGSGMFSAHGSALPDAGHLFHLGSHLWGRTLHAGDRILGSWTPDGAAEPAVRFEYDIIRADPAGGPSVPGEDAASAHPAPHAAAEIVASVRFRDEADNSATFYLYFDSESPYPTSVEMTAEWLHDPDHVRLPVLVGSQSAWLVERGATPVAWEPAPLPGSALGAPGTDSTFLLVDHPAPAVLDTLPLYPLAFALDDVELQSGALLDTDTPLFPPILVDAVLGPVRAADVAGSTVELAWTLTFWDPAQGFDAWRTARAVTATGALAPVAHSVAAVDPPGLPWFGDLSHWAARHSPLGEGEVLAEAWRNAGAGRPVDTVAYRLVPGPGDGLLGALSLGTAEPVRGLDGVLLDSPAVLLSEDLVTGRLIGVRTIGPD